MPTTLLLPHPSLNTLSCNRRPLCSTFIFENVSSPKTTVSFQKKQKKSKKKFYLLLKLSRNTKSPLMQDWVLILGATPKYIELPPCLTV